MSINTSPQRYARIAGLFYLAVIALGLFGEVFVRGTLVVAGDAAATLERINQAKSLWRAGIAGDLMMHVFDIPIIVIFYLLLRPVSKSLALCASFINLIQTAVLAVNKLNLLLPLFLLESAHAFKAFSAEQITTFSTLAISAHGYGFAIGLIFFGFACFVRGYLIYQSKYLPKALGVLLFIAGLSYLINSFTLILKPSLAQALFPTILVPAFIGELALSLWLIFKGIDVEKWQQQSK